ncbi:MAG: glycine dehydrogenase, partial [Gammaproteobacteria bacterium]|nr:glycine dehydrogenase [Gammaproteobacteria bacterium]
MPYIPHTDSDVEAMLAAIGANTIDDLFDEIPAGLRRDCSEKLPERLTEMEAARLMRERAVQDAGLLCFAGAGAYEHHIPAAVWEIATRGEFYTAYTPYQAEASQGTLQLLYEFQTMMANLTGMEAANASLYDGASALAEAVLMAVRLNRKSKSKRVLMPSAVHPAYRKAAHTIVKNQQIFLDEVSFESGQTAVAALEAACGSDKNIAAAVIPQP